MYDKSVLDNGLRILSSSLARSVSVGLYVGAGSR